MKQQPLTMKSRALFNPTGLLNDFTRYGLQEILRHCPQQLQGVKIAEQNTDELKRRIRAGLNSDRYGKDTAAAVKYVRGMPY